MADQKYPPETAGSRAITAFPRANVGDTVSNIEKMLTENKPREANPFYS